MRSGTNNNNNNNNNVGHNNNSTMISLPRGNQDMEEVAGAQDTIYLCNFRVSVDGEWLCLKELQDLDIQEGSSGGNGSGGGGSGSGNAHNDDSNTIVNFGIENIKSEDKLDRDWVNYCRWLGLIQFQFFVLGFFFNLF